MRRTMMASVLVLFASQAHAGGDESTWGAPAYSKKAVEARSHVLDRIPQIVEAPAIPVKRVESVTPTVEIATDSHGQPICDYGHAMFAGRNDLFQRYCTVQAESTAEPSSRNNNSPQ